MSKWTPPDSIIDIQLKGDPASWARSLTSHFRTDRLQYWGCGKGVFSSLGCISCGTIGCNFNGWSSNGPFDFGVGNAWFCPRHYQEFQFALTGALGSFEPDYKISLPQTQTPDQKQFVEEFEKLTNGFKFHFTDYQKTENWTCLRSGYITELDVFLRRLDDGPVNKEA